MKTVAYYTRDTAYEREADLLRSSLEAVGMDHEIVGVEDAGSWRANTARKATFLRRMRSDLDGPLLYVDADAFVHENCTDHFDLLSDLGFDFGAHWFRGPAFGHDRSAVREEGWWMLSGTLFLGDTDRCRWLLDAWCALNETWAEHGIAEGGGQKNLWFTVTCLRGLHVKRLRGRYCYVFDKPWAYPEAEYPVIEHTIASRIHRGESNVGVDKRRARLKELRDAV